MQRHAGRRGRADLRGDDVLGRRRPVPPARCAARSGAGGCPLSGTGSIILGDAVFAYLDPGTGSMLVQLLVGGVAAVGVAVKLYWHRILRLLRIRKTEPEPDRES